MNSNKRDDGINNPHNACCYRDKCRQQQVEIEAAKQLYLDAFERGKQIGYTEGMMNRPVNVQNIEQFTKHEQEKKLNNEPIDYPPLKAGGIIENNEPVAWVYLEKWMAGIAYPDECFSDEEVKGAIPLYTHSHPDNLGLAESIIKQQKLEIEALKAKTLTDEEIYKIAWHFEEEIEEYASGKWAIPKQDFVEFARAILRKAQEE